MKAYNRWLQTKVPVDTARRLMAPAPSISSAGLRSLLKKGLFKRIIYLPRLWDDHDSFSVPWGQNQTPWGTKRLVRVSLPLLSVIEDVAPAPKYSADPCNRLLALFQACCCPRVSEVFCGPYTPARLLHMNDYIVDKAFVYGVILLSKWLGSARFPLGIFGAWPPAYPFDHGAGSQPTTCVSVSAASGSAGP